MATLHPFRAVRPVPELAAEIASVPYDVINTAEARQLAEGHPHSFLHVIRPEIDLPLGVDEHDDAVYEKGAENLERFVLSEHVIQETEPSLYLYQLVMNERAQVGIFGCVSVEEYDNDTILKHEKTRKDKEDDRTRHLLTQRAHAEPVMLTFRDDEQINAMIASETKRVPLYDFTAADGIQHTIWKVADPAALSAAFCAVDKLYVADGHHRCKAASRAAEQLRAESAPGEEWKFFPAVIFPMSQMLIMPYNRIVRRLAMQPEEFVKRLAETLTVEVNVDGGTPSGPGKIRLYTQGSWIEASLPQTQRPGVADRLDVARLNEYVFETLLNITDPRTDKNLDFVGGIRGTRELEMLVDSGQADLGISMYATSIQELIDVSDAGLLMPPKSTWFEPKLRSGLLVHLFD